MSVPYLNRGESIVLTTHRVTAGSVLYDLMLTNQRLILMDSHYDRLEPEMIPFTDIVTVKGGKAATGEPAIILTLKEPNDFSDSAQLSLIFTQNPNEKRRHERELWVRKLIELVIRAREQEAQSTVVPVTRKNGLQPAVRRWEAPEPIRPRSSVAEPAHLVPEPVIITEQEPDSLEFFLEEKSYQDETVERETEKPEEIPQTIPGVAVEAPRAEIPPVGEEIILEELLGMEPVPEPESLPVQETIPRDPFAGIHIPPPRAEPVEKPQSLPTHEGLTGKYHSQAPFGDIVRAAASSLNVSQETPAPDSHLGEAPVVKKTSPLPDQSPKTTKGALPAHQTPGGKRELPGTYAPEISAPSIPPASPKRIPPQENAVKSDGVEKARSRKSSLIAAALAVIAIIAILAVAAFTVNSLYGSPYSNTVITITPSAGTAPAQGQVPADLQPAGVYVRVICPGDFTGSIGNPGLLRQVSGRGDQNFSILMTKSIVQATIRKQDSSPEPLTVEIYNNSTLLASRTVTAPQGEVSLLIDTMTAAAPGMSAELTPTIDKHLLGNGSLIYY